MFRLQMLYVCVHPGVVLNDAFCMTYILLMVYPHPVAMSTFIICRRLCACTEIL